MTESSVICECLLCSEDSLGDEHSFVKEYTTGENNGFRGGDERSDRTSLNNRRIRRLRDNGGDLNLLPLPATSSEG
jgi:hypothetical protein